MAPTDRRKPGPEGEAREAPDQAPELSSRGKIVIRSSSHPPGAELPLSDPPPDEIKAIVDALREKKDTPAEGRRGRRKVQAKRISAQLAAVAVRESAGAKLRASEAREVARMRSQDTRLWWTVFGLGVIVALLVWASR